MVERNEPVNVNRAVAIPSNHGRAEQSPNAHNFTLFMERLSVFERLLSLVSEQEAHIAEGNPYIYGTMKDGNFTEKYMDLDSRFVGIWNQVASRIYEELMIDPAAKEAADNILHQHHKKDDDPEYLLTSSQIENLLLK